jgi:hypothetical protein
MPDRDIGLAPEQVLAAVARRHRESAFREAQVATGPNTKA